MSKKLIITDLANTNFLVNGEYTVIKPEQPIHNCIGCFGCWVKTPGKCIIKDGYENTGALMGKCDELILISRCNYGSVSPFVKMVQDRAISYIHPNFVIRKGEMHHKRRYHNVIKLTAYFYGDDISRQEQETARKIMQANVDNYDGELKGVYFLKDFSDLEKIEL